MVNFLSRPAMERVTADPSVLKYLDAGPSDVAATTTSSKGTAIGTPPRDFMYATAPLTVFGKPALSSLSLILLAVSRIIILAWERSELSKLLS